MILNRLFSHIVFMTVLMVSLAGCHHQDEPSRSGENEVPAVDDKVTIRLSIDSGLKSGSRAGAPDYFEAPSGDFEKIYTLRVILVKNGNEVEANKLVKTTENGHPVNDNLEFKVSTGSKRVYLIANEASLPVPARYVAQYSNSTAFLDDVYLVNSTFSPTVFSEWLVSLPGGNPSASGGLYSNIAGALGLPLTEFFDFNVGAEFTDVAYDETQTVHLFLTRASAKVTFNVQVDNDYKASGVSVTAIRLSGLNWQQYVFPRSTQYSPAKEAIITPGLDGVVAPEMERYITNFATPARVNNVTGANVTMNLENTIEIKAGTDASVGPLYIPESLMPETVQANPAARFMVQVKLDGTDQWLDTKPLGIEPNNIQLVNGAQAISRNTHLKVTINFGEAGISSTITVVPYIGVTLDPVFGTI